MKDQATTDKLYVDIQQKIDRYRRNAVMYSAMYYSVRVSLIFLAAFITLITAYKKALEKDFGDAMLWLGAITTILTAVDTLYQAEAKRNTYKIMLHDYRLLHTGFAYHLDNNTLTPEKRNSIYEECKRIESFGRNLSGSADD